MRAFNRLTVVVALVAAASCGKRVPEPPGVAPGTPHVSWVLMTGDRDTPDANYVCQSDPKDDCVISAGSSDHRVFTDFHVYYHGTGADTRYRGSILVGYFDRPHTLSANILVRKGDHITNQSFTDIVTSVPGTYEVTFDLTASTANGVNQSIHQTFPVTVK